MAIEKRTIQALALTGVVLVVAWQVIDTNVSAELPPLSVLVAPAADSGVTAAIGPRVDGDEFAWCGKGRLDAAAGNVHLDAVIPGEHQRQTHNDVTWAPCPAGFPIWLHTHWLKQGAPRGASDVDSAAVRGHGAPPVAVVVLVDATGHRRYVAYWPAWSVR